MKSRTVFVVQESGGQFWYDHPDLREYSSRNTAVKKMNEQQKKPSGYKYRVIKRTECVVE